MAVLSDKSLQYLDKSQDELKEIALIQKQLFNFEKTYMLPEEYFDVIQERKRQFINDYKLKEIWSWNYAEYKTYQQLTATTTKH